MKIKFNAVGNSFTAVRLDTKGRLLPRVSFERRFGRNVRFLDYTGEEKERTYYENSLRLAKDIFRTIKENPYIKVNFEDVEINGESAEIEEVMKIVESLEA
ncbi:MAG TPA: hypothetical protein VFD17_01930 [Clostridia bacterium]|nr:hypothetical protein [Clostridia bacterium]